MCCKSGVQFDYWYRAREAGLKYRYVCSVKQGLIKYRTPPLSLSLSLTHSPPLTLSPSLLFFSPFSLSPPPSLYSIQMVLSLWRRPLCEPTGTSWPAQPVWSDYWPVPWQLGCSSKAPQTGQTSCELYSSYRFADHISPHIESIDYCEHKISC